MSSIFGWSYPPGCNGTPFDDERPCEICGEFEAKCICPECPECGETGRPTCYRPLTDGGCGCQRSQAQIDRLAENERRWREQNEAEGCGGEPDCDG